MVAFLVIVLSSLFYVNGELHRFLHRGQLRVSLDNCKRLHNKAARPVLDGHLTYQFEVPVEFPQVKVIPCSSFISSDCQN